MPFYCDIAVFSGERFTKGKQYAKIENGELRIENECIAYGDIIKK